MGGPEIKPLPPDADVDALRARAETALREERPGADLVAFVRELFAEGYDEGQALGVLEDFRAQLREQDREADEDAVMDVMDRFYEGWCGVRGVLRRDTPTATNPDRQ